MIKIANILLAFLVLFLVSIFSTLAVCEPCQARATRSAQQQERIQEQKEQILQKQEEIRERVKERVRLRFVHVYRATIQSIGDNHIVVQKDGTSYTINIVANTHLRRRFWGKSDLSEFKVGDLVSVIGRWVDDEQTVIEARIIKNLTIQRRWGTFFGTVVEAEGTQIVIESVKRGNQTVYISVSTVVVSRDQDAITITEVQVGDKIRVKGVWDSQASEIRETDQIKDFSLPL